MNEEVLAGTEQGLARAEESCPVVGDVLAELEESCAAREEVSAVVEELHAVGEQPRGDLASQGDGMREIRVYALAEGQVAVEGPDVARCNND